MTISDSDLETGLRDHRARAAAIAPPPADLAERTRARYRAQRRSRAALAAGGLVALVVFVGVPVVASTLADAPAREVADRSARTFVPAPPAGLYAQPTRGSLPDDEDWLTAVTALPWAPVIPDGYDLGVPDPPVDTRRVAFAGDVTSGRVALVLGMVEDTVAYAWFTGPAGAAVDEMTLATFPSEAGPDHVLALRDAPDLSAESVTLVVVAAPGDSVDVGLTPVVEASGTVRSDSFGVDVVDGVATVDMDVPVFVMSRGGDVRVRSASGQDRPLQMADSDRLLGGTRETPPTDVVPADPRGLLGRLPDPQAGRWATGSQLAVYGLAADQAQPTLLAAGPLGSRVNRYGELYGMTHPSGATSTWLVSYSPGTTNGGTMSEFPAAPAGTALLDRVIAVQAMAGVLVSAPAGVEAQVVNGSGAVVLTVPLERGSGTAPLTDQRYGTTVRVLDVDGTVLAETPLVGQ